MSLFTYYGQYLAITLVNWAL